MLSPTCLGVRSCVSTDCCLGSTKWQRALSLGAVWGGNTTQPTSSDRDRRWFARNKEIYYYSTSV